MAEFTKVFTNNSQFKLILTYSHSQNITNNTTTVNATLKVQSMAYGVASGWTTKNAGISINGNNVTYTFNPNMGANSTKTIATRSYTFNHNADGSKSVNISANADYTGVTWNGGALGNVALGGNVTLPTIPRASTIGTVTGDTIGSGINIQISRASSSFTHEVSITMLGAEVKSSNVGTSVTLTPPLASFCGKLPNSTSGNATVTVVTKNGLATIGTKTKNITLKVPSSVVPVISSMTTSEKTQSISALNLGVGVFVQGKSNIEVTVLGDGVYGSTITSAAVGINGIGSINSHTGTFNLGYAHTQGIQGTIQVSASIMDSRGRWTGVNGWINVLSFEKPFIKSFYANRIGNGTVVEIHKDVFADRIGEKTGYIVLIDKRVTGGDWANIYREGNSNATVVNLSGFDIDKSYELRISVLDYFQEISSTITISTSKTLLDLNKDIGIGIGKINEGKSILEIDGSVKITNGTISGGVGYEESYMPLGDMYSPSYWINNFPLGMTLRFLSTQPVGNRPMNYMLFLIMKFSINDYRVFGFSQPSDNNKFFMLTGNQTAVSKWSQINTVPV